MAQIVHDLAPGASDRLRDRVRRRNWPSPKTSSGLAAAGATVIVDDVGYFEEPFFQDGPVAVAINEVVAKGRRLLLGRRQRQPLRKNAGSGNNARSPPGKRRHSATPAGCPPLLEAATCRTHADHCLDFDPGAGEDTTFGITVEAKAKS